MEIIFQRELATRPQVSFILLDWSCRESFHIFHYLARQTVPRDQYEIIWIEYYDRRSPEIQEGVNKFQEKGTHPPVDQWVVLDMPETLYYHKHLMYNVGIALSRGNLVTICDSDAMVKPTFVETLIRFFEENPDRVLHLDEVRNNDKKFHPFRYPSFEEVEGPGAINFKDGTTTGILDQKDPLHSRNYGACMCAPRADLIAIGGADEHLDYLGHVCGPYEMTFRLRNLGREEVWHPSELLYHVWHPGQAGHGNYVGPHDGRHMSSTALSILASGRVPPLLENEAIRLLREGSELSREELTEKLIPPSCFQEWTYEVLDQTDDFYVWHATELLGSLRGYNLVRHQNRFYGIPQWWGPVDLNQDRDRARPGLRSADTLEDLKQQVEALDLGEFPVIAKGFGSGIGHRWRKWKATFSLRPYKGYNLLRGGDRFYAVPQSLGTLDLNREEDRTRLEVLSAESVKTLKKKIEEEGHPVPWVYHQLRQRIGSRAYQQLLSLHRRLKSLMPGSYREYNLRWFEDRIYAVPRSIGPVDLTREEDRTRPEVLSGASVREVKQKIAERENWVSTPVPSSEDRNRFTGSRKAPESRGSINREVDHPSLGLESENGAGENPYGGTQAVLTPPAPQTQYRTSQEPVPADLKIPRQMGIRREYNIVLYHSRFYGVPHQLGSLDLTRAEDRCHPQVLVADSLGELDQAIDRAVETSPRYPRLRKMLGADRYNALSRLRDRLLGKFPGSLNR